MSRIQVRCVRKRGGHFNAHERIEGLGGADWYKEEVDIILEIENGINSYFVKVGTEVDVVVALHLGRKYLKTRNDGISPDNLLSLPDC